VAQRHISVAHGSILNPFTLDGLVGQRALRNLDFYERIGGKLVSASR